MAKSARARSTCPAGALSERLRRVSSWRSSAVSGRRGSFRWRDMGHLGARGSPHHYTRAHGRRPTSAKAEVTIIEKYDPTINDEALTELMLPTLRWAANGDVVRSSLVGAAEDFSFFA